MFADPAVIADLKEQAARRPDMADVRSAGTGATAPGGHPRGIYPEFPTIDRPERAEEFVDARVREGSDYLKVVIDDGSSRHARLPTLSAATVSALTTAAHDRGRIEVGRRADLVLLDGDPLADITATRRIAAIWRGGYAYDRAGA